MTLLKKNLLSRFPFFFSQYFRFSENLAICYKPHLRKVIQLCNLCCVTAGELNNTFCSETNKANTVALRIKRSTFIAKFSKHSKTLLCFLCLFVSWSMHCIHPTYAFYIHSISALTHFHYDTQYTEFLKMLEINQSRPAHWCNPKKHASKQLLGKTLQNPTTLIFEGEALL